AAPREASTPVHASIPGGQQRCGPDVPLCRRDSSMRDRGSGSRVSAARRGGQARSTRVDWSTAPSGVPMRLPAVASQLTLAMVFAGGASSDQPSVTCGLAAMTGPLVVLEAFGRGNALDQPPATVPASLPVRLVAGPVLRGIVGKSDSAGWVVGAE